MTDQDQPAKVIPESPYGKYSMLWRDDNPNVSLETRIIRAASYYREKYGRTPEVCRMNSKDMIAGINSAGPIRLQAVRYVMPGYFLLGDEEHLL